jgi:hypothetical protein
LALVMNYKFSGGMCRKSPHAFTAKSASLIVASGTLTCRTGRSRLRGTWQGGEACHARGDKDTRRTPQLAGRCMKTRSAMPAACTGKCSESAQLAGPPSLAQLSHAAGGPKPSRWGSSRHCSAETSRTSCHASCTRWADSRTSRCHATHWPSSEKPPATASLPDQETAATSLSLYLSVSVLNPPP